MRAAGHGSLAGTGAQSFGQVLRRYRRAAGLTQEELAERAGLSTRAISALEQRANQAPRKDTVALLAAALGLTPEERAAFVAARHPPPAGTPGGAGGAPPLVGRAGEEALLAQHLGAGAAGGPPVLLLAGEPGIGKTRLLQEARRRGAAVGWTVLWGGGAPGGGQDPYTPLVDSLARHLAALPPAGQRAALGGCAWLVRLLPELAAGPLEPLPPWRVTAEQARRLMLAAARRFLAQVAGVAGTLLVLDDLQWAGADALGLLQALVREEGTAPLRVVGAYRATEVPGAGPLAATLAGLAAAGLARQHDLRPLRPEEAAALLNHLLDGHAEGHTAAGTESLWRARVVERTEGVPFFVVSQAEARRQGTADALVDAVPWTVAQSVRQRVATLPDGARQLLEVAAVAGRVAPRGLLITVAGQNEREAMTALQAACHARLLEEEGEMAYRFAHDVIREVVEASLGAARRALLHREIARALEGSATAPIDALAYHYACTEDHGKAAYWLEYAADRAAAGFASILALDQLSAARTRLMASGAGPAALARVDEKVGDLSVLRGDFTRAQVAYAQARLETTEPARRAELWRKEGTTWAYRRAFSRALACLDAAEAEGAEPRSSLGVADDSGMLAPEGHPSANAALPLMVRASIAVRRTEAYYLQGDLDRAEAVAEHLVGLLGAQEDSADRARNLAHAYHYLGEIAFGRDNSDRAADFYRRGLALNERVGDQAAVARSWLSLGYVAWAHGNLATAEECFGRGRAILTRMGHELDLAESWIALGCVSLGRGNLTQAEERMRHGLAAYERLTDQQSVMAICWFFLAHVACERGALADALKRCRAARRLCRGHDAEGVEAGATWVQARAHLHAGHPRIAASLVEHARGLLLGRAGWLRAWLLPRLSLLDALVHLEGGAVAGAQALAEQVSAQALSNGRRQEDALAHHVAGRCARARGDLIEARASLHRALQIQEELGFALDAARTRVVLADMLVAGAAGGPVPDDARALLAGAIAQLASSGAALDLARARQLAATWEPSPDGTEREVEGSHAGEAGGEGSVAPPGRRHGAGEGTGPR